FNGTQYVPDQICKFYVRLTKCNALVCKKLQVIHDEELVKNGNISSQRFSYIVKKSDNIICCRLDEIENKY
ncbi:hypothetical protein ALC60_03893, partial [Trachymyrmex zeteki]